MTPDHEQLLTEMTQYLVSQGCEVYSAAYADICNG